MFDLNNKTEVNKVFKIREIFKMINADKDVKRDAEVIEKISLTNVISKETLNIKSDEYCREIYVFNITLKEKRIPIDFIKELDKNIELHTYFVFEYEDEFKEVCIYRYVEDSNIKRGRIYESEWGNKEIKELPYCINVCEIYNKFILNLVDLNIRENENINDFLERFYNIKQLKKEISALEKKAFKESQPRKKFDIGREVKIKKEKLKGLEGE